MASVGYQNRKLNENICYGLTDLWRQWVDIPSLALFYSIYINVLAG